MAEARARPGLLPALAALLVVVATISLGNWQLRRADEKRVLQAARDAAVAQGPLRLDGAARSASDLDGRLLQATGVFEDARSVFLDNRTHQGRAGFHVFTPLRLEQGGHLLVLRGWVPRDALERTRLPSLRALDGPVTVQGLAEARLGTAMRLDAGGAAGEGEGGRIWQAVSLETYARWSGLALQPVVLRQANDTGDGLVREWPRQEAGVDKHLGYAFQWFALAAATAGLWLWYGIFRNRHGRSGQQRTPGA